MEPITIYADINNGISTNGADEFVTETIPERLIDSWLDTLEEGEYIKSKVSKATYDRLNDRYGIEGTL